MSVADCAYCGSPGPLTYSCPVCGTLYCQQCIDEEPDPCCTGEPHDPSLNDGEDFEA